MQSAFASFLFFSLVFCASAQYQLDPEHYYKDNHNQGANPHPSFDVEQVDERFIKTVSLTLSTTTITSTTTSISTCTTSTAGLSVCTASGRRRRGLNLSGNKEGRGLFYNENEENREEGSIFLPSPAKDEEQKLVQDEVAPVVESQKEGKAIPYVVQSGYSAPSGQGRVLLYFGTSTTTTTVTTTTTSSLTATCRSTTGYQVCGSQGKK